MIIRYRIVNTLDKEDDDDDNNNNGIFQACHCIIMTK